MSRGSRSVLVGRTCSWRVALRSSRTGSPTGLPATSTHSFPRLVTPSRRRTLSVARLRPKGTRFRTSARPRNLFFAGSASAEKAELMWCWTSGKIHDFYLVLSRPLDRRCPRWSSPPTRSARSTAIRHGCAMWMTSPTRCEPWNGAPFSLWRTAKKLTRWIEGCSPSRSTKCPVLTHPSSLKPRTWKRSEPSRRIWRRICGTVLPRRDHRTPTLPRQARKGAADHRRNAAVCAVAGSRSAAARITADT